MVNWVQPATQTEPMLSYLEHDQVDDLTLKGNMTNFNDSYEMQVSERGLKDENKKSTTDYQLLPKPDKDIVTRRTHRQDHSLGLQAARDRTFCIGR